MKNYSQTEGQSAFLSRLQSTKQTTEHLLQRQNRAMYPSQCMTYANFP